MKSLLRLQVVSVVVTAVLLSNFSAYAAQWLTSLPDAKTRSSAENKPILAFFTGSDWCPYCVKIKGEVFDTREFKEYSSKVILLELDFPQQKKQDVALRRANEALARQYGVQGFPTVLMLNKDGKVLGDVPYNGRGPNYFIKDADAVANGKAPAGAVLIAANPKGPAPAATAAKAAPAAPVEAKPVVYNEIILKGISGSAKRKIALINNEPFMLGDELKVNVGGKPTKVKCEEIGDDYVVVVVDGKPGTQKLTLGK